MSGPSGGNRDPGADPRRRGGEDAVPPHILAALEIENALPFETTPDAPDQMGAATSLAALAPDSEDHEPSPRGSPERKTLAERPEAPKHKPMAKKSSKKAGKKPAGKKPPEAGLAGDAETTVIPAKVAGEATVAVRNRALDKDEEEQGELPVEDTGLPPGLEPPAAEKKKRKKKGGGGAASGGGNGGAVPKRGAGGEEWRSNITVKAIDRTARNVFERIVKGEKPELKSPVRALSNVHYKEKVGYFEIGRQNKVRTLTFNTVRTFAQTLRMMSLSKEMVREDTFATKRDAYYQSKNWEEARFDEQAESDTVMDDIEAMFALEGVSREQLRFYPEEHGGAVAGELFVIDRDPVTGGTIEIDCTKLGSGSYNIPHSVEHLRFRTKAKFILAIETGGMFQRLQYHAYPTKAGCIIISMSGVPTRACRRFIRRLSEQADIPVYAFVDCDPYGISNIYRSLKVGSGNAAHINRFFCVPNARFLGVTPDDIEEYKLPTHPLKEVDVVRAKDALKNDPFFKVHRSWAHAMEKLLRMGVRAEQQALAKWGLNYVMDVYLPNKLKNPKAFLP